MFAQAGWRPELREDLVTIEDGKLVTEDFTLIDITGGGSLQLAVRAEAPNDGNISRDNFVAMYSVVSYAFLEGMMEEAGVPEDNYTTETLDELNGEADIRFDIYMTSEGMQLAVTTDDGTERFTQTWDEVFEEE